MANLTVVKNGEFWEVYDVDRGVTILSLTNQSVANRFAAAGVDTREAAQIAIRQDVNYEGGVQTNPQEQTNTTPVVAEQTTTINQSDATSPYSEQTELPVPLSELDQVPVAPYDDSEAAQAQLNQELLDNAINSPTARSPGSYTAAELNAIAAAQGLDAGDVAEGSTNTESDLYDNEEAAAESSARQRARQQQAIASQRRQVNNGDWRVKLSLAPRSQYLYNAPEPGILQPLFWTDGVIFPYTPAISTGYKATYSQTDLTHSNYRGYFYGSSAVEPVNITATFTAQDTSEANYLLAVIHFFRSATKMFYGQDAERGSPPPVVYLTGLGEYQFNEHSCLISSFSYNLPADVDYIRAGSPNNIGTDLTTRRDRQTVATNGIFGTVNRLASAFLSKGALNNNPRAPATLGLNRPTYVPTKMEIQITLLPIQSRNQVSKQFSVKEFANGNLLRGGFW